ncbi:MAG: hypothetical protein KJ697_04255 [Nanoarchaeota archaeon]|nr:hypothetical protein [Nanoarchaeota archaeon]
MEQHEKTVNMKFLILMVVIIVIIFVALALQWTKTQQLVGMSVEFSTLCVQWQNKNCEIPEALEEINSVQRENDKFTLTEECLKSFNQGSNDKTIVLCQDICKNKCNPQISYDIAVYKENIKFVRMADGTDQVQVEILNLGSGSVFDVAIEIRECDNSNNIMPDDQTYNIPSHGSLIILATTTKTCIEAEIMNYDDAKIENNYAERDYYEV